LTDENAKDAPKKKGEKKTEENTPKKGVFVKNAKGMTITIIPKNTVIKRFRNLPHRQHQQSCIDGNDTATTVAVCVL